MEKKQKKSEKQDVTNGNDKENSNYSSNNPSKKLEESSKVVQKAQTNKKQAPLTRTDIELKVLVMKVVELKKELKARGKDANGLKKDLRNRLINVMVEDLKREETQNIKAQKKVYNASDAVIVEESQEEQKESSDSMDISKDSNEKPVDNVESQRRESVSSMQVEHHNEAEEQPKEIQNDNFKNSFSLEQKQKQSQNKQMFVASEGWKKPDSSLKSIREKDDVSNNKTPAHISENSREEKSELTESKVKQFSEMKKDSNEDMSGPPSEVSFSSTSGNSVKDMVSKFSGFSSNLSSGSSGSALSKGLQAKKEARQAKIAEMRAKVRLENLNALILADLPFLLFFTSSLTVYVLFFFFIRLRRLRASQ